MKIVTNSKLIKRNAIIGKYSSIAALVILGIGLYITFKLPEKFAYSMGCLLVGFLLSQFGIYFGNRWGRNPRPDQIINKSLKGLGREYTIYHYISPASHLLIGPAGVLTILPFQQGGRIIYDGKRWKIKGGGFARSYLRIFGQENIGRPDLEAGSEIKSVTNYLMRILPEGSQLPDVNAALLFTDPKVELEIENPPLPAMTPKELKEFIKDKSKINPLPDLVLETIRKNLPQPDKEEQ
jgi:hypothetical protein